jgi:uncharacterized protein DUF6335
MSTTKKTRTGSRRRRETARVRRRPEPVHQKAPTALAAEAMRIGVLPAHPIHREPAVGEPEAERMQVGDPEVSPLENEYSGDELPGGSNPTPDQNQVDEIGRAYGVEEEDGGALRTTEELLHERDRHRRA